MTTDDSAITQRLEVALQAARKAGRSTLDHFQRDSLAVERKSDDTPVTVADRNAERILREHIIAAFPNDAILGEELGEQSGKTGYRWILDPIDGTKSFIFGVPLYTTLVGVEVEGRSVVGIIYAPALDECVYAASGHGTWFLQGDAEPGQVRVSNRALAEGLFVTSQVDLFAGRGATEAYLALERSAYVTRSWGDGYGYLLVATGRAELMVDAELNLWDAAALQPVIEEAGGTFTDWQGRATMHGREAIATNGIVLDDVLDVTRHYPRSH
jgi:histidinol phosphatase-like enzyme (inositol monophosphatase family)